MAYKFQLGAARLSGSVVQEGAISADGGNVSGSGNLDIGGNAEIAGTVKLAGVAEAVLDVNADFLYFQDADGTMKKEATGDYASAIAGVGIGVDSGVLKLDLGELSTAAVADGDFFGFIDATDGSNKKDAVADLATLFAGDGLAAANSVMKLDVNGLAAAKTTLAQADLLPLADSADSNVSKKISFSNLEDQIFGNVSGDAAIAAGGALTIQADAVEGSMLNDNVISGQSELAHADINDADELMISDGGTLKKVGIDSLQNHYFAAISGDATVADGGALTIANDAVEQAMIADDAVGADQLAANAVVNASVDANAAIALSKINTNVDMGGNFTIGSQADDIASFTGGVTIGGDLIVNGSTTSVNFSTINITSSFTFEGSTPDAHETVLGVVNPTADATINLPAMSAGTYHLPVLAAASTTAITATPAELNLVDGGTARGTDALADGDGFLHNDNGTMKQTNVLKIAEYAYAKFSGDATVSSAGALTIAADAVEGSMLNDNVISGQSELAHADIADADELMISDGGTLKKVGVDSLQNHYFAAISGDATVADGGALTIAADAVESGMLNDNVISGQAQLSVSAASDIAAGDELLISDAGTIKRVAMSGIQTFIGNGKAAVSLKDDGDTLAIGVNHFGTHGGAESVSLPASAGLSVGQSIKIKAGSDCSATNKLTINKAGSQTIDGETAIILESPFAAVELIYVATDTFKVF